MGSLQMGRQKVGMTMEKRSSLLIMLAAALWGGIGVFFKQLSAIGLYFNAGGGDPRAYSSDHFGDSGALGRPQAVQNSLERYLVLYWDRYDQLGFF